MSIYLDWAATAMPQEDKNNEAHALAQKFFGNPSSKHSLGRQARELLEDARATIAHLIGVTPDTIYFTSGGSEANSIVELSLLTKPSYGNIAISAIEHSSVKMQATALEQLGWKILEIPVTSEGIVTPEAVLSTINRETSMVAIMSVNNETGIIQPIKEIGQTLRNYSKEKRPIHFHTDAVQAFGKIPFHPAELPIDSASMSGHKIGAPRGIGFLYLPKEVNPFIRGASQEKNIRPGTENLAGILSLAACMKETYTSFEKHFSQAKNLMQFLIEELLKIEKITLIPSTRKAEDERFSPWIVQFAFERLTGEVLARCFSDKEIYISTGSACSVKKVDRPILRAMNVSPELRMNAARLSIGPQTTLNDITLFIKNLKEIIVAY